MEKIVIFGAGPAGLTAALELLSHENQYDVTILEKSNCIGGISRTVQHDGNRMDIGGHRFFSKSPEIMQRWIDLMPLQGSPSLDDRLLNRTAENLTPNGPDPETEDVVFLVRNRVSRIYYLKKFFDYPISMKWQTFKNMGFSRTMKAGFSYLKSCLFKLKEDNLENFYINRFGKVLYGMFFEKYTEKLWGRRPADISADWGAQRVKGLSVFAIIGDMFKKLLGIKGKGKVETSLIEKFYYPKFGPGQLWETVAEMIQAKGGKILFDHCVTELVYNDNHISDVICAHGEARESFPCDAAISSMPLKDLVAAFSGDPVPLPVADIAKGLPYRDFVTVGLLVDRLLLENKTGIHTLGNIIPDCWIYVQEPDVKLGRIQIFNNWSPYMVKDPVNSVWIGLEYFCEEGDAFWNLPEEDCVKLAVNELAHMGVIEEKSVIDHHREKVQKAYPAYFDTYAQIDDLTNWLDTIDNLYCVGRNGQHRYNNMDHSMLTAIRAVACLVSGNPDRSVIWNVNTEKEYHEKSDTQ